MRSGARSRRPSPRTPGLLVRPIRHRHERSAQHGADVHIPSRATCAQHSRTLDEPGPYVVVGHSFGGAEAVAFASMYPNDVGGLLLLDASPTTWPDGVHRARRRIRRRCGFAETCAAFAPAANPEQLDAPAAFAEVDAITSLGALPMTVVTAAAHPYPGLDADRAGPPHRRVEHRATSLGLAVVSRARRHRRRHRSRHPARSAGRRDRSNPRTARVTPMSRHPDSTSPSAERTGHTRQLQRSRLPNQATTTATPLTLDPPEPPWLGIHRGHGQRGDTRGHVVAQRVHQPRR